MHHCSATHIVQHRELGLLKGNWISKYKYDKFSSFGLGDKFFSSEFEGAVTWLDLDHVEKRYLLAAGADATISIYDTQDTVKSTKAPIDPICSVKKNLNAASHRFLVSGAVWYPVDTGLFVTCSFDQEVKVWDTNTLQVACHFSMPAKVYAVAMSPVAGTHCLVAAGSAEPHVKLCDPASGGFTHTLVGHREGVWAVAWMFHNEFQLVSGDAGGQVRVWDVRRSGCMALLDQYTTQRPQRPAAPPSSQRATQGPSAAPRGKRPRELPETRAISGPAKAMSFAEAHQGGSVNALLPTPDGLHLISAGTDSKARLWHAQHHHNLLTHYQDTVNRAVRGRQLSTNEDGRVLFHPSRASIQVFDVVSGAQLAVLEQGHFDTVNCCIFNPLTQELYTGGSDYQVLAWSARRSAAPAQQADERDAWSDEEG